MKQKNAGEGSKEGVAEGLRRDACNSMLGLVVDAEGGAVG